MIVATAIGLLGGLLIVGLLFALADDAIIGISSEHGAEFCPECHDE